MRVPEQRPEQVRVQQRPEQVRVPEQRLEQVQVPEQSALSFRSRRLGRGAPPGAGHRCLCRQANTNGLFGVWFGWQTNATVAFVSAPGAGLAQHPVEERLRAVAAVRVALTCRTVDSVTE